MESKNEVMERACEKIDSIKQELLGIVYRLEDAGAIRKANSLYTIIGRLEQWEHTK